MSDLAARRGIARTFDPTTLIWIAAVLILLFLVANPAFQLIRSSLQDTDTGAWTLSNYAVAYGSRRGWMALGTSLLYGTCVTLLAVVIALPIAWAESRTDMPAKKLVRTLILGAFITPSYLGAIGWILLAGPNAGWLNKMWMAATGSDHGLLNIFSFPGLVFVTAIYSFPYIFVFAADALDLVSSEMEEASSILGASGFRTVFRVTLPMVTPAILGGMIVVFLDTVALFGTPAIIALPARINVMTLQLWQFFQFPVRVEAAAAYAIPLVLITCALFLLQRAMIGRRGYVALTGKGGGRRLIALGGYRWLAFGYAMLVCSLSVLLPFAVLSQAAFSRAWGKGLSWSNTTFANFRFLLFEDAGARATVWHSFLYSAVTACGCVALALVIAYVVNRRLMRNANVLAGLAMAPFVIPGIVLAIGFYAAYAPPPLALYGTAFIMILGYTTRFLPIAFVNCTAGLRSLNPEMEEAVRILGGTRMRAVTRVVVPLLKKSLMGAWLLVFIPATRELSTAVFLVGSQTRVISVMLMDLSENGSFELMAALGFLLLGATILIVMAGYRIVGRDLLLKRS